MIGTLLNRRYRLDAEIGRGGMGVVYRAYDTLLERPVGLKILGKAGLGSEGRTRLLREARAVAQLNHRNIVSLYDVGGADEAGGASFIVMELVEGQSLFQRRPQSLDETLSIAGQICTALEHAHAHAIVHRDLKPENVLITPEGLVKLMDFGLARSVASRLSSEGAIAGTAFYLAPEQALGQEIDGRVDLYALGVILYELTTGRLPFTGDDLLTVISQHLHAPVVPPSTYNVALPPALDALIVQLLSKQPRDRPASAAQVRQALEHIASAGAEAVPVARLSLLDRLVRGRLVGREREFAEAKALWQRVASAPGAGPRPVHSLHSGCFAKPAEGSRPEFIEGHVLLVTGEPGIGKTRFVHELATLVRVSRANVLRGECYAEGGVPYAPVAQLIREGLAALGQRGDTFTLPDLVVADLLTLAPDLHARYPGVPPNPPLDPHAEQQRLFESVVALCVALVQATRAPLLLVMEDVHWADGGTLFLLRHLARRGRSANLRLLMILTYREAELDQACCLSDVLLDLNRERIATRIKLERLSREQTRDMLAVMLAEEVTPEFLEAIYRETEGNPFFVEEVCKALIEEGKLYRENGRWHRPSVEEIQVPQSVRLAIQARVGKLPAQAQDVLRLAAVVGREFDFGTLRQASDLGEEMLIDALEAAERAQLIGEVQARSGREAFAFAHALIPTALRENVSGLRRHRLHRRVAAAIEALRPDDCEALAYHYGEAGDEGQARTYYIRAAERARKLYANEEAVRFYSEALALIPADHADRFDLLSARAQVYDILARREAQHADVEAMLALAEKLDDDARRCDALIALADFHLKTEHVRAREPAERAAEIARKMGDRVREGFALRSLGYGAWNWLDLAQSRSALEAAVARFREADLPGEAAVCLHMLSLTLSDLGEHAAAEGAVEQAVALSRQAGDRRHEAISLRRLAIVHIDQFRHAQALPFAAAALALHRELGDQAEECHALNVMGIIMAFLSRPEEAQAYLSQSLAMAEAIGLNVAVPHAAENLTWFHFRRQGEYEAGLAFVEERLAKARLANDEFLVAALLLLKATLLTWLGQYAAALELAQSGLPMVEALSGQTYQVKVLSFMGFLQAKLGNHERARQYLDAALERAGEEGRNKDAARVLTSRAYQAWLEGGEANLHLGLEQAQRAIALLTSAEYGLDLADALDVTAQLHLALGEEEAALTSSSEAMRLVAAWPFVPEGYLFTHACALRAARRAAEADDYLRRAYECVMLVASKTHDPALHRSWLEDVQVNRAILAAWAQRP